MASWWEPEKAGEHQLPGIGVACADRNVGTVVGHLDQAAEVVQVESRIDPLGVQVEPDGDDVHVAGALAVAEQRAFHPLRPGHQPQLGGRHAGAAVVVGVQAEDDAVAAPHVAQEPLDLVGVHVGRGQLHRGRQVDDHAPLGARVPRLDDRVAHLHRVVELGAGEALRRVLVHHLGVGAVGQLAHQAGAVHRNGADLGAVHAEHDAPLQRGGGVVQVHDGPRRAFDRLEGAPDQVVARLGEHLRVDIARDQVALDQRAGKVELHRRRRREPDLDLLEADVGQEAEHAQLLLQVHRVDQRLVAVAQIDAAPGRRLLDGAVRPPAVRQVDDREGSVLGDRSSLHGLLLISSFGEKWRKKSPGSQLICPINREPGLRLALRRLATCGPRRSTRQPRPLGPVG